MKYSKRGIQFFFIAILTIILSSCEKISKDIIEDGVSYELALLRDQQISNITYNLSFTIPDSLNIRIRGYEIIEFDFKKELKKPLIIDFRNPEQNIISVKLNSKKIKYKFVHEHIIISHSKLQSGTNQIEIEFIAGERALNRNKEYLYTLFVPDRACTAFPCFDQPSLKARFKTQIKTPKQWNAVTNAPKINTDTINNIFCFDITKPISTYLYSFTAGKFKSLTRSHDDREITMYHREDDAEKLNYNIDRIFDLHFSSLEWLEDYTQIKYPFKKFDFVIIPSFQYSGMEHPGAILYRDSRLFLNKNSSIREELNRANLIAHETAHIWFGDLVTMQWFSEVWLKEVFANFIAGKIINPQYPEINHDLNFLINHYPASYSIDRTKGANPIEQQLDNMKNAGTLYGQIIYHKAPIVMNHLEKNVGQEVIQQGLQEYLTMYSFDNASWDELINILDKKVDYDLESWNQSWIYEPGMPHYYTQKAYDANNQLQTIIIEQCDPAGKGRQWSQSIETLIASNKQNFNIPIELSDTFNVIDLGTKSITPLYIFPNSNGLGYGYFEIDSISKKNLFANIKNIKDPVLRCSMYISLWENMLNQSISSNELYDFLVHSLISESNQQNISLISGYIETLFWKFINQRIRKEIAIDHEAFLWKKIKTCNKPTIKKLFFDLYYKTASTKDAIENLYSIWEENNSYSEIKLSEEDFNNIAFEIAIRDSVISNDILRQQRSRISNPEKKERFEFIAKAITDRDNFFESLKNEKTREKEPWVIDGLEYLHHPLKQKESVKYIIPSLEILEELQKTGDIFFPKRWLDATFKGHSSIDAVMDINLFLNTHPDYPENLKNKIIQSTDLVFRASIISGE